MMAKRKAKKKGTQGNPKKLKKDDSERCMRASRDIEIGTDLHDPIYPYAATLHDNLLPSRCSSCFCRLPRNKPFPCHHYCKGSVSYCTQECRQSDRDTHIISGECRFLALVNQGTISLGPSDYGGDYIRLALRLLHHHYVRGSLVNANVGHPRIGNLISNYHRLVATQEDDDTAEIKAAAGLMRMARGPDGYEAFEFAEEMALCQTITNSVLVKCKKLSKEEEGKDFDRLFKRGSAVQQELGTAVYGPLFSWCDHSCRPNATYRLVLKSQIKGLHNRLQKRDNIGCLIEADINGYCDSSQQKMYGPTCVLRAISKLSKGDQIFVPYTSLFCSKEARQNALWEGYRFHCHCERCDDEFQSFADRYVKGNSSSELNPLASNALDTPSNLGDILESELEIGVNKYEKDKKSEALCERLENQLRKCVVEKKRMQTRQSTSSSVFKLNPLHFICLDVCGELAFAYRVLAMENSQFLFDGQPASPQISVTYSKEAAAYSLLHACGVHYHFYSGERGLMSLAAKYWLKAGEDILRWVAEELSKSHSLTKNSLHSIIRMIHGNLKCNCLFPNTCTKCLSICQHSPGRGDSKDIEHGDVLLKDSQSFISCMKKFLTIFWPALRDGIFFLEGVPSPVDYNWFVGKIVSSGNDATGSDFHESWYLDLLEIIPLINTNNTERYRLDRSKLTALLCAVHCLLYSKYLFVICHGADDPMVHYIGSLF